MKLAMRALFRIFALAFLVMTVVPAKAQEAVVERTEMGESGSDYLRSIRVRRIDPNVSYFDPSAPPPELNTAQEPERVREDGERRRIEIDTPSALIATAILVGIAYLFFRFGGSMSVSLRSDVENARRAKAAAILDGEGDGGPVTLQGILGLADRRMALVLLAQKALQTAVSANGVLFQRSWTARDALRRVQGDPGHVAALRALVLDSERVQFGGRDVSEDDFQSHVAAIRPIIAGGEA